MRVQVADDPRAVRERVVVPRPRATAAGEAAVELVEVLPELRERSVLQLLGARLPAPAARELVVLGQPGERRCGERRLLADRRAATQSPRPPPAPPEWSRGRPSIPGTKIAASFRSGARTGAATSAVRTRTRPRSEAGIDGRPEQRLRPQQHELPVRQLLEHGRDGARQRALAGAPFSRPRACASPPGAKRSVSTPRGDRVVLAGEANRRRLGGLD